MQRYDLVACVSANARPHSAEPPPDVRTACSTVYIIIRMHACTCVCEQHRMTQISLGCLPWHGSILHGVHQMSAQLLPFAPPAWCLHTHAQGWILHVSDHLSPSDILRSALHSDCDAVLMTTEESWRTFGPKQSIKADIIADCQPSHASSVMGPQES